MPEAATPTLAAAVVLVDREDRVLLVRENYGRRRWGLPGGSIEPSESPQEAAIREVLEETGLLVELEHLVALYYLRSARPGLRFVFRGRIVEGEAGVPASDEIADLRWCDPDDLPQPLTDTAPVGVRDAAAGLRGVIRDVHAG